MASVTETLRRALAQSGESRYSVAKATGIPESSLSRFAAGGGLGSASADALCRHLDLVLVPAAKSKKRRAR